MFSIPRIGVAELVILTGIVGLAVFAVVVIVTIVRSKQETRRSWKWPVILVLLVLIVLPLLIFVFGAMLVTPVQQRISTPGTGTEPIALEIVTEPTATPLLISTLDVTSTNTLQSASTSTSKSKVTLLSLNPFSELTMFVVLPAIAGLVLLVGTVVVTLVLKRWQADDTQLKDLDMNASNGDKNFKSTRSRYFFLAFIFWIALSIFLVFDLAVSVSVYFKFTAIYAGFWTLVGALFLYDRPMREKLLILLLFLIVVFSIRFVNWNSRKPFLKDLYSVREGMSPAQVEQIMSDYWIGGESPFLDGPETERDEQGDIITGGITYLHTDEGWGNSDWGVVIFEHGRVVRVEFLPD